MTKPAGSRILQTRLEMIGYSVVTTSDGEEALSDFRLLTPDLIVLSVMMPFTRWLWCLSRITETIRRANYHANSLGRCSRPNHWAGTRC